MSAEVTRRRCSLCRQPGHRRETCGLSPAEPPRFADQMSIRATDYATLAEARAAISHFMDRGWHSSEVSDAQRLDSTGGGDWMPEKTTFIKPIKPTPFEVVVRREHCGTPDGLRAVVLGLVALGWRAEGFDPMAFRVPPKVFLYKPNPDAC